MAEKNDGGDKNEKPTPKRLRDARNKGDLAKSKDFGTGLGMVAWLVLTLAVTGYLGARLDAFARQTVQVAATGEFRARLIELGGDALWLTLLAAGVTLIPSAIAGLAGEFIQIGPLLTGEKLKPTLDKLNPVAGLKRMISLDNLFELAKTLVKAVLILAITGLVLVASLDRYAEILGAARGAGSGALGPQVARFSLDLTRSLTIQLVGATAGVFLLVAFADWAWTRHRHIKKLMMSRRDIRQEHKDNEGDPHLKSQRRQMHEEWANQNAIAAAGRANVLLTNPTHLAIALDYDPEECPVPVISAKGEGPLAAAMRRRAEEEGVPLVRNVALTRTLWATASVNDLVPEAHFDAIAEIILWARRARNGEVARERDDWS